MVESSQGIEMTATYQITDETSKVPLFKRVHFTMKSERTTFTSSMSDHRVSSLGGGLCEFFDHISQVTLSVTCETLKRDSGEQKKKNTKGFLKFWGL